MDNGLNLLCQFAQDFEKLKEENAALLAKIKQQETELKEKEQIAQEHVVKKLKEEQLKQRAKDFENNVLDDANRGSLKQFCEKTVDFVEFMPFLSIEALLKIWKGTHTFDKVLAAFANTNEKFADTIIENETFLTYLFEHVDNLKFYIKWCCNDKTAGPVIGNINDSRKKQLQENATFIESIVQYSVKYKIRLMAIDRFLEYLNESQLYECIAAGLKYSYENARKKILTVEFAKKIYTVLKPNEQCYLLERLGKNIQYTEGTDPFYDILAYHIPKACILSMDNIPLSLAFIIQTRLRQLEETPKQSNMTIAEAASASTYNADTLRLARKMHPDDLLTFCSIFNLNPRMIVNVEEQEAKLIAMFKSVEEQAN